MKTVKGKTRIEAHERPVAISVCLINHRATAYTLACLRSLSAGAEGVAFETILIENTPREGCAAAVRAEFPAVRMIENAQPLTFGENNNLALRHAVGRYVLFLNNDTVVRPGALRIMLRFMEEHGDHGACSAQLMGPDGMAQTVRVKAPSLAGYAWQTLVQQNLCEVSARARGWFSRRRAFKTPTEVEDLCGACMLIRREVLDRVGGFDEGYRFYFEDCDLSLRIVRAGWRMAIVPAAVVMHHVDSSLGRVRAEAKIEEYRSARRFYAKHGRGGLLAQVALKSIWLTTAVMRLWAYALLSLAGRPGAEDSARAYVRILGWHVGASGSDREKRK